MAIDILFVLGGLLLLFLGGESLIKGSVSLARNFQLSNLLVSAVVVGFGTSMPEMTVSVSAALRGTSDIAIGNVVGSNICNILLIVGLAALLNPISAIGDGIKRDTYVMLGASLILCALALTGIINIWSGILMFALLIGYIAFSYHQDKKRGAEVIQHIEEDIEGTPQLKPLKAGIYVIVGLGLLIAGAYMTVDGAVAIARDFGISEAVIGLTIVAVGTSLPELVTSVVAAYHKHSDIIIGNIVGSNIFNIFGILGVTGMISPIPISAHFAHYDVWIMLFASVLLAIYLLRKLTIGRFSGFAMLLGYCGYTAWLYIVAGN